MAGASAPRVAIWQGDADYTVRPKNLVALVEQWTDVNGVSDKASTSTPVGKATHDEYKDASGVVRVESWSIKGMSHGVAVDPSAGCGTAGAYVLDEGLCSTTKAAAFFGLVAGDGSGTGSGSSGGASSGGASSSSGAAGSSGAADDCAP